MAKSPPQIPSSPSNTTPPPPRGNFGFFGGFFRLFFLGLVGVIGTGGGIALGVFLPDRNPQAPFLEIALQYLRLTRETRVVSPVLPSIVPSLTPNINNSPEVLPASPTSPTSPTSPASSSPSTSTITPTSTPSKADTAQLQQDLQQLQQQLKETSDRTASLERKLGISSPSGNLETRLEKLSQQVQTSATPPNAPKTPSPSPSIAAPPTPTITPSASPNSTSTTSPPVTIPLNSPVPITSGTATQRKITLPIDPLFDSNSNTLRPETILLLSQVANELRGIPGTTVQVTVHNNLGGEPNNDRRLSFQQAKTIREYLATQLGDRFRFVAIGYGSTRPLVVATGDRPENRRIEIIVE